MKNAAQMLRDAEDKFVRDCRDFAIAAGVTPEPCTTRKPTPAEALELKIKLPWGDKVQAMTPDDLTPDLFKKLEAYGVFRAEITKLFGMKYPPILYRWMKKNGLYESAAPAKPLRGKDFVITKRNGKAALEPKVLEERATEIMQDKMDAAIAGDGPIPGPADVIPVVAQAVAEQVAKATREQVEEFFTDGGRQCGKTVMMSNPGRPEWPNPWPPSPEEVEYWNKTLSDACAGEPDDKPADPALDPDALKKIIEDEWRKTVVELPIDEPSGLAVNQHHYNACGPIQPIEAMQASMDPQRFIGKLQGDIIKYAMRAGKKGNELADVEKIIQYSNWWAQALRGETINPREVAK